MKTPLWILNFLEEGGCTGSFLETWWKAYRKNGGENARPEDCWFHVSDCAGKSFDNIYDEARHLTLVQNETPPLIPLFDGLDRPKKLTVVFLGDIVEKTTQECFHLWSTWLRERLLDETLRWTVVPNINFYGILLRPATASVAPGVTQETRGFLQELYNLMRPDVMDVNHIPFRSVSFIEHNDKEKARQAAIEKMNLAVLHLSGNDFIGNVPEYRFADLSATGVFYEASVHNEQGVFLVSNKLLQQFAKSEDSSFFDPNKALEFVDGSTGILSDLSSDSIADSLVSECPQPGEKTYAYDLKSGVSPWSLRLRKIWNEFYCDFIPNYKKSLVNRVKRELRYYKESYLDKLFSNQKETVNRTAHDLERAVFRLFSDDVKDSPVSIRQAKEVLRLFRKRIENIANSEIEDISVNPFMIPVEFKNAARQARAESHESKDLLGIISGKIAHFPVVVLALISRVIILGFLLGMVSWGILSGASPLARILVSALLGLTPLVVGLLQYRVRKIRLNTLKKQYVGMMLEECSTELRKSIVQCLKTTYDELLEFCDWLDKHKLDFLSNNLAVLPPPGFSFIESTVLKPLVTSGSPITGETNALLIPPTNVNADEKVRLSGSFGQYPLLDDSKGIPAQKILVEGVSTKMDEILKKSKLQQKLVRELLQQRASVKQSVEKDVDFTSMHNGDLSLLLLLDVSGSMCGNQINELKEAVSSLSEKAHVDWIAFNHEVTQSSFDGDNIKNLKANGGTSFLAPIERAIEVLKAHFYDQIILISDGCPSESIETVLSKAYELRQPLNTISIGNYGAAFMKELSDKTSGEQIIVDNVREIVQWEGKMKPLVTLGENGEFSFGELVAKCHIPGCAMALHSFVLGKIQNEESYDIVCLLSKFANKNGLTEWAALTRRGSTLTQTANPKRTTFQLGTNDKAAESLSEVLKMLGGPECVSMGDPLILATLVSFSGLDLKDFLWAGLDSSCADLNDREQLQKVMGANAKVRNIYDKLIN
jgi:uncharacterized protein YegL